MKQHRVQFDTTRPGSAIDFNTGSRLFFYRASDSTVDCFLTEEGAPLSDSPTQATLYLQKNGVTVYTSSPVAIAACTPAQWRDGTGQHARFEFDLAGLAGAYQMVVAVENGSGLVTTVGFAKVQIYNARMVPEAFTFPAAPTVLTATEDGASIDLAWTDNATGEDSYEIWRSADGPLLGFTLVDTIAADSTAYTDTGLELDTQYWYKVRAIDADKDLAESQFSNVATATTGGGVYYAVAPAGYSYSAEEDEKYSTRKYNTLAAAEAALDANPTAPLFIEIIGDWTSAGADTTAVTFAGVNTTAGAYVQVQAIGSARHAGVWSTSKYRLEVSNTDAIDVQIAHLRIDGLLIGKSSSSADLQSLIRFQTVPASSDTWVSNCVLRQAGNNFYGEPCFYITDADADVKAWNCIMYGYGTSANGANAGIYISQGTCDAYSCISVGGRHGFTHAGGTFIAKNCYGGGTSSNAYNGTISKTTCASSDATGDSGLQSIAADDTTFVNVSPGTQDFHLADSSPLIEAGTDTSSEAAPLNFTTDIDGTTRSGTWDIGADDNPNPQTIPEAIYFAVAPAGYSYSSAENLKYSTRKYNTLAAAEAALYTNPIAPCVIEIIGDWTSAGAETTPVTFAGVTTTATKYVKVTAVGTARHSGVWNTTSAYRLLVSNATAIKVQIGHLHLDGIQIGKSSSSSDSNQYLVHLDAIPSAVSAYAYVSNCILKQAGSTFSEPGIYTIDGDAALKCWNTLFYGFGTSAFTNNCAVYWQGGACEVYSCTAVKGRHVYRRAGGTFTAKNCYGGGSSSTAFVNLNTLVTCASSDTSGSAGLQSIPADGTVFQNVGAGTEDYHLVGGSALRDVGTDTSSESAPLDFTTDIDGDARGAPWSVGIDE